MYHRGQGIRKSSRSSRSRPDRVPQSRALAALDQEAQKLASGSPSQDTPTSAPVFDSGSVLDTLRAVPDPGSSGSPGGFGLASQTDFGTGRRELAQRRVHPTPSLRFWPSQPVNAFHGSQQTGLGGYSEHLNPYTSEYRSPTAAMR
ncbi:MAG: hypothetical protein Q9160_006467 [Pyrenula sp. 1 TL-2023]